MSWEGILKRSKYGIPNSAKKYIRELMSDGEKRTEVEILDGLWKIIEKLNEDRKVRMRTAGHIIPTSGELRAFLSKHYESAIFDTRTDKILGKKKKLHHKRKYWMIFGEKIME